MAFRCRRLRDRPFDRVCSYGGERFGGADERMTDFVRIRGEPGLACSKLGCTKSVEAGAVPSGDDNVDNGDDDAELVLKLRLANDRP